MSNFLLGIEGKYPKEILKGRIEVEGNVISCFMKDMLLMEESSFQREDFITQDGVFFYSVMNNLKKKGFNSLDEVTIMSNCSDNVIDRYMELGGWDTIQHQIDIINTENFDTYADILYRENIICQLHKDGFNLTNDIELEDGNKVNPLKMFRKMSSEEVTDWYESRLDTYGRDISSKVLEEEVITFTDEWLEMCEEGIENGVPFDFAGIDVDGEKIQAFPFLSNQINGLLEGTFTMMGGFSSTGKSSWWVTVIMALLNRDRKVLLITNEENVSKFKQKLIVWLAAKHLKYYKLTKKKFSSGERNEEFREVLKQIQQVWRDEYSNRLKIVSIEDADMRVVKKKIRTSVLRDGYDTVLYDTFKLQESNFNGSRQDLELVRDSRVLHSLAKKYNIIMLASIQLAEYMKGKLFLDSSVLSNSKQVKEVLENLFLMRNVFDEELDPQNNMYCNPFRTVNVNGKWEEQKYAPDRSAVWRMLFVEKTRNGSNSSDTGVAYLLKFDGDHCTFSETAKCRPKHGEIK